MTKIEAKRVMGLVLMGIIAPSFTVAAFQTNSHPDGDTWMHAGKYAVYKTEDRYTKDSGLVVQFGKYEWRVVSATEDSITIREQHSSGEFPISYEYAYEIATRINTTLCGKSGGPEYHSLLWIPTHVEAGSTVRLTNSLFTVVQAEKALSGKGAIDAWKLTGRIDISEGNKVIVTVCYDKKTGILLTGEAAVEIDGNECSRRLTLVDTNILPIDENVPSDLWTPGPETCQDDVEHERLTERKENGNSALEFPQIREFPHTPPYRIAGKEVDAIGLWLYPQADLDNDLGQMFARIRGASLGFGTDKALAIVYFEENWISPRTGSASIRFYFDHQGTVQLWATPPNPFGVAFCAGTVSIVGVVGEWVGPEISVNEWNFFHNSFWGGVDERIIAGSDVYEIPAISVIQGQEYFYRLTFMIKADIIVVGVAGALVDINFFESGLDGTLKQVDGPKPDRTPPAVFISNPIEGDVVCGIVPIYVEASDDVAVDSVRFFIDGSWRATDSDSPYRWNWDTTVDPDGSHTIRAAAYDPSGNFAEDEITVEVDNATNLDILQSSISAEFTPPNPWVQEDLLELTFTIAALGDLHNVVLTSDDLLHESLPKGIDGHHINFTPSEIDFLGSGEEVDVTAYIQIPIGQHEGQYIGNFRAIASAKGCSGGSDSVEVEIELAPLADVDMDRENVALAALPGESDADLFIVANPNKWDNNPDPVDGPGNVKLVSLNYGFSDLVGPSGTIPSAVISISNNEASLVSGESDEVTLRVDVPVGQSHGSYTGRVFVCGTPEPIRGGPFRQSPSVCDSLLLQVCVLRKARLDIVEDAISDPLEPPNPWTTPLSAEFFFTIANTGNDTLENICFFSTDLEQPPHFPTYGHSAEFNPPVVPSLSPQDTIIINVSVPVPVGQHTGTYTGSFYVTEGLLLSASDSVSASVTVEPLADIDIQDYSENIKGNEMILTGVAQSVVVGSFNLLNPNLMENNVDLFDGPGNTPVEELTAGWNDLETYGRLHSIDSVNVSILAPGLEDLESGGSQQVFVQVNIPQVQTPREKTYSTTFTVSGMAGSTSVSDQFTLRVRVVPKGDGGLTGFWGAPESEGICLHWSKFDLGETGFNLHRKSAETMQFERLNESLIMEMGYLDRQILTGHHYEYKLGLVFGDGPELLVGPITVSGLKYPPGSIAVLQNHPNPFHLETVIAYELSTGTRTHLAVYDSGGRLVRTLVDGEKQVGHHSIAWDGRDGRFPVASIFADFRWATTPERRK